MRIPVPENERGHVQGNIVVCFGADIVSFPDVETENFGRTDKAFLRMMTSPNSGSINVIIFSLCCSGLIGYLARFCTVFGMYVYPR